MRRGPNGDGIPFNPPLGYEDLDFGVVDADAVVRYFNESNATTNPGHDIRGTRAIWLMYFLKLRKLTTGRLRVGLVTPIYFCLFRSLSSAV